MFRPTDPQLSLLESRFLIGPRKRERLERSWAEVFRNGVLPLIDEESFRECFDDENGRPNKSIRLLVGLHILKEVDDLTDEQVLDALEFNIQWQHALAVDPATAHVCARTLHNFRHHLMESERGQGVFEHVTAEMMKMDGLSAARQRLDSTHVISNIAVLTRLGLFTETVTAFLRELRKEAPEKLAKVEASLVKRYLEREGYFADATREQAQRRLPVAARDLFSLVKGFEGDATVTVLPSYALLVRLLGDQCDIVGGEGEPAAVVVKEGREIAGTSLQSPHDPDATYGHKGKGYEAQVVETCVKENPYEVITAVDVGGAHASDQSATVPMAEKLAADGHRPEELLADAGYGSGENIIGCAELGVKLYAPVQDPGARQRPDGWTDPTAGAPPTPPKAPMELADFEFSETFGAVIRCPAGAEPIEQHATDYAYFATFSARNCAACPLADTCITRRNSANEDRTLRWRDTKAATATRQREQQTPEFKDAYKPRSGIESTNAELKRRHGLGRLRVRRRDRVKLAIVLKALALNVKRALQYHTERIKAAFQAIGTLETAFE